MSHATAPRFDKLSVTPSKRQPELVEGDGSLFVLAYRTTPAQRSVMRLLLILAALLCAPTARAQTIADLHWLKGCWRTVGEGPVITEVWLAPPAPVMLGYAYTVGEGEVQGWEQTRIEMIDGWPHFVAMPEGAAPVRFRLRETDPLTPSRAWFDNPEHDYPQTVEYHRDDDRLHAAISGANGADRIQFEYRRIRCPSNLRP